MRKFKGIELPVNSVIIIALAIFVLLMLAAFFGKSSTAFSDTEYQTAFNQGCAQWANQHGCEEAKLETVMTNLNDGTKALSLKQVCATYTKNPLASASDCRKACNTCPKDFVTEGSPCCGDPDCQSAAAYTPGKTWTCDAPNCEATTPVKGTCKSS